MSDLYMLSAEILIQEEGVGDLEFPVRLVTFGRVCHALRVHARAANLRNIEAVPVTTADMAALRRLGAECGRERLIELVEAHPAISELRPNIMCDLRAGRALSHPSLWPERLRKLVECAHHEFVGVMSTETPGDFLDSLVAGADVAGTKDRRGVTCAGMPMPIGDITAALERWAADERRVLAAHPSNDNDEQSEAAVVRGAMDSACFAAPDLAALCLSLCIDVEAIPCGGTYGVVRYAVTGAEARGKLYLETEGGLGSEWAARYVPAEN